MDQVLLWAPWLIVAAIAGALLYRWRRTIRIPAVLREVVLVVGAYAAYYVVRGLTAGGQAQAIDRARSLIDFEQWLNLYHEPAMQDFVLDYDRLTVAFNWVYIWWHWPLIIVVALWLFLARPFVYRRYRNAFVLSGAVSLAFFAAVPVAPPRIATPDIVDTISLHSEVYRSYESPAFVNLYAAFPSLHFAWNLLASIAVFAQARQPVLRAAAVLSPVAVFLAIVVTGNHFIIDALAGGVLAVLALVVATAITGGGRLPSLRPPPRVD